MAHHQRRLMLVILSRAASSAASVSHPAGNGNVSKQSFGVWRRSFFIELAKNRAPKIVNAALQNRKELVRSGKDRKSNRPSRSMAAAGCRSQSPTSGRHGSQFAENCSEWHRKHCPRLGARPLSSHQARASP